jgi:hypothetical protein
LADRLYLSCWIRGFNQSNMLRHLETLLDLFPFSNLAARGPTLRIYALEHTEPPQLERDFPPRVDPADLISIAGEFSLEDCVVEVDAAWDLWQFDREWKLAPAAVTLSCFGPQFDNEVGDHLRIDFGPDARYLPDPGIEGSVRLSESNLKSLVTLTRQIEGAFKLERRRVWSDSGENPAELIAQSLES